MKKSTLAFCLSLAIVFLGLTTITPPPPHGRDPVPDEQKVAHSIHCAGCHGPDTTGLSMVDKSGHDVSVQDDWQISMMGLSAHDPFWRATLAHEVHLYPDQQQAIESTCLKCHAPLGSIQSHLNGELYSFEKMLNDSLGLDGVSCSACHQQPRKPSFTGHSGNFEIDTSRVLYGHYPNPFKGPMQIYVRFEPEFSENILNSEICAGCHTLITETLDADGQPSGNFFVEQATYHEWLNSVYPAQGTTCQSCHVPFIEDPVVIASGLHALEERFPYGLHQFFGANTAMLSLMKEHQDALGLPKPADPHTWDESIANNRTSLNNAVRMELDGPVVSLDTMTFTVSLENLTGHKVPSGYPNRLMWLQVMLTDSQSGDTLYINGQLNTEGDIVGRDFPFEPHHEISRSADEVQIYEMAMSDLGGHLTTRLNAAYRPLKDNRLLPKGFQRNHAVYDTVAIWGNAYTDIDYDDQSQAGKDLVTFHIPLISMKGLADLHVSLMYQSLPVRWMNDLFNYDSLAEVSAFKGYYAGYERMAETMQQIQIPGIQLSPSSVDPVHAKDFNLYPNPVSSRTIQLEWTEQIRQPEEVSVEIVSSTGKVMLITTLDRSITLPAGTRPGTYFARFIFRQKTIAVKKLVVL